MIDWSELERMRRARGPRYLVHATIRVGEFAATYAPTAKDADRVAERYRDNAYRNVTITPPVHLTGTAEQVKALAKERRAVLATLDETTHKLRAAVAQLILDGASEVQAAELANVDRMTVRSWLGKR